MSQLAKGARVAIDRSLHLSSLYHHHPSTTLTENCNFQTFLINAWTNPDLRLGLVCLTQEFKTLGMDDYLWVQALFNHEELERLRGQEPTDPHQRFLWKIIRMGVIDPEAGEKVMDTSTRSMRPSLAIGMRLWKMWREAKGRVSHSLSSFDQLVS